MPDLVRYAAHFQGQPSAPAAAHAFFIVVTPEDVRLRPAEYRAQREGTES